MYEVDGEVYEIEEVPPLRKKELFEKSLEELKKEKGKLFSKGNNKSLEGICSRRDRKTKDGKVSAYKNVQMYNEQVCMQKNFLIQKMNFAKNFRLKEYNEDAKILLMNENGEVKEFVLSVRIYKGGTLTAFEFKDRKGEIFNPDIMVDSEDILKIVLKCGLSSVQYNFIRSTFKGMIFPKWEVIEKLFSNNRIKLVNMMSVIVSGQCKDVTIGFYLDIPSLLCQLLNDEDIILDYIVRSVLGQKFFSNQEEKRNEYCRKKIAERDSKKAELDKNLVDARQKNDEELIKQQVSQ